MKLAEYMRNRGITQAQIARESGVSQQCVSRWLAGSIPAAVQAQKLIEASRRNPTPEGGTVTLADLVGTSAA